MSEQAGLAFGPVSEKKDRKRENSSYAFWAAEQGRNCTDWGRASAFSKHTACQGHSYSSHLSAFLVCHLSLRYSFPSRWLTGRFGWTLEGGDNAIIFYNLTSEQFRVSCLYPGPELRLKSHSPNQKLCNRIDSLLAPMGGFAPFWTEIEEGWIEVGQKGGGGKEAAVRI